MEFNDLEFICTRDVEYRLHILVLLLLLLLLFFYIYKLAIRHFSPENDSFLPGIRYISSPLSCGKMGKKPCNFF